MKKNAPRIVFGLIVVMLFIVINTSSIQLIPFTVIGLLASYGSRKPNAIFLPVFLSTVISSVVAVIILFSFRAFYKTGK